MHVCRDVAKADVDHLVQPASNEYPEVGVLDGYRGCKASNQERNVVVVVALVQGVYNDDKRARERLLVQPRQRLQDEPLPLVVQAEPVDAVSSGRSIGNVPAQLR